jgi:hypothetical protein
VIDVAPSRRPVLVLCPSCPPVQTGELYRVVRRQPILHPAVALRRSVTCAIGGAIFGGVMDYFDIARPSKPVEERTTVTVTTTTDSSTTKQPQPPASK